MYKKTDISWLAAPVALIALGLVLLLSPDTVSALLSRLAGWGLTAAGFILALMALLGDRSRWVRRAVTAGVLTVLGVWLKEHPLAIAAWAGRLVGILLLIQGLPDAIASWKAGALDRRATVLTVVGAVLLMMPMTTSRVLISLGGVALIGIGIALLVDRLRYREPLEAGRPDIIDADE